jgi:hypothetical protein
MKPARNPRYLAFIRTLPCAVCGTRRNIEAAHTGPRGLGQKAPDTSAIPLCVKHHRTGSDSYHKLGRRFAQYHRLDIQAIVRKLNAKLRIHVIAGSFVVDLGEDIYKLGPVQEGLDRALRKLEKIRFEHYNGALV